MKKITALIILTIILFVLTSCNIESTEISETIKAPENLKPPIYGEWIIEDYKIANISVMDEDTAKTYLGKEAFFHEDLVAIGEEYCINPVYKIKNVRPIDYLIYQYKTNPKFLNIDEEEIQIVSITGEEQFFYEFIKESEDSIIAYIDGVFFYFKLVSENVREEKLAEYYYSEKAMLRTTSLDSKDILKSTVLIGLKSMDMENEDNFEKWNYRTLLIRTQNKNVLGTYEMEDVFFPRKTGFWKLSVNRIKDGDTVEDNISVYPIKKAAPELKNKSVGDEEIINMVTRAEDGGLVLPSIVKEEKEIMGKSLKNILYVGNDYISLELINYLERGERILEFHPIDNLEKGNPMKISDIAGEIGKVSFLEEANKEILAKNEEFKESTIDLTPDEESFGLFRRNGHWIFKGRVNFSDNGVYSYKDFNIRAIPSKEVVHFDQLFVPWNAIKTKVPEAVDAFTSPNEDIILVITHNNILIYTLENGYISDIPLKKIQLKPAEKIIMLEWGIGRYGPIWEDEFIKNGGTEIVN